MFYNLSKLKFAVFIIIFLLSISFFAQNINAQQINQGQNEIYFFYSTTCPHCAEQEKFLNQLENNYPDIVVKRYEFSKNVDLISSFYNQFSVPKQKQGLVPITFTKDNYFVGFNSQTGLDIIDCVEHCLGNKDVFVNQKTKIPFLGEIDTQNISLPLLAVIFGFFDGFNVCSLGALVLILGMVISLNSRKKILILGGTFVLITIIVYWVLILLWHRLFVFMAPYIRNMEIFIGLLSFGGAWFLFREFLKSRKSGSVCKFGGISEKLASKMNKALEKGSGIFVMVGAVLFFASAVTIIEFPCSALFPVLFTGILAQNQTSFFLSVIYMGIYILFYMIDEIIVVVVAALTMKIWIASPKITTLLNLFASLLLFVFGFYYLLWPIFRAWFNL